MDHPSLTRLVHDDVLRDAARTLDERYTNFTTHGSGCRFYSSGEVPRWMIIGTVEQARLDAFAILEEAGVFHESSPGSHCYYRSSVPLDELFGENHR